MLKNFITLAFRRCRRQPGYTFINVFGLAVGMACCVFIGLYVRDELSFDRFHERSDRIYAVARASSSWGTTPYPLASAMEETMPEIQHAVRMWGGANTEVLHGDEQLRSDRVVMLTEPSFFRIFSFSTVSGDPSAALARPDGVVLTASTARAFFGDENPIGRTLQIPRFGEDLTLTVGGVVGDVPPNSTIQFDIAAPLHLMEERYRRDDSWGAFMYRTYALTTTPMASSALDQKLATALAQRFQDTQSERDPPTFTAYPLTSVYLSGLYGVADGFKGQFRYIYIFGSIALVVLLIAGVNYVNLVTAQATQRAREVGVRKALGAGHAQLVRQFLGESILMSLSALGVALLLTYSALPAFNRLFDKNLNLDAGELGFAVLMLCAFALLIAIVAGVYPAFVLARFKASDVLRGAGARATPLHVGPIREGLVVFQFTITVVLIMSTAVIYKQLDYAQTKNLGFDGEQVVVVDLPSLSVSARASLKQQVLTDSGVRSASLANGLPSQFNVTLGQRVADVSPEAATDEENVNMKPAVVDTEFIETLGLTLIAGRGFSASSSADRHSAYVLNEAAAASLGWSPDEAVGRSFRFPAKDDVPAGEVVGVVENFHVASLHQEIAPIVLKLQEDASWQTSFVLIAKLAPDRIRAGLDHVAQQFARIAPGEAFEYEFLDDRFDAMYRVERRLGQIFTTFAGLAVFIACMGLFGLAAFTAQRRTKEIGIRKVLGASVAGIVALLSKDFLKLVVIAFVLAAPLAYLVMNRWLDDFAYRIEIGVGMFLAVGGLALLIAILAVGYQSISAALADPARSLRYE